MTLQEFIEYKAKEYADKHENITYSYHSDYGNLEQCYETGFTSAIELMKELMEWRMENKWHRQENGKYERECENIQGEVYYTELSIDELLELFIEHKNKEK